MINISILLVVLFKVVSAFTNGTLLPAYLCGPANDGMPKSLGQVLNFAIFDKDTPLAFNNVSGNNLAIAAKQMTGTVPPNTAFMLASFHNSINSIKATTNTINVSTTATLTPGQLLPLTLASRIVDGKNVPLDGCFIYAESATGQRLGSFTDNGGSFSPWPACGLSADGKVAGMVHHQIVAAEGIYTGLSWNAPANLAMGDKVTIKGAAVDDAGFGTWGIVVTVGVAGFTPLVALDAPTNAIQGTGLGSAAALVAAAAMNNNGKGVPNQAVKAAAGQAKNANANANANANNAAKGAAAINNNAVQDKKAPAGNNNAAQAKKGQAAAGDACCDADADAENDGDGDMDRRR
jgi:hypothetical protein